MNHLDWMHLERLDEMCFIFITPSYGRRHVNTDCHFVTAYRVTQKHACPLLQ